MFVFRIDSDTIADGGCGNNSKVLFQSCHGRQLGSTAVTAQNPCFSSISEGDINCRFGESVTVDGMFINEFQAICLTTSVSLSTFINIYLSSDSDINYQLFSQILTYTPVEYGVSSADSVQVIILNRTDIIINMGSQLILG